MKGWIIATIPWITFLLVTVFPVLTLPGCKAAMAAHKVPVDFNMVRMEWNGTKGWFVPDARLESIGLRMDELIEERD